MLTQSRGSKIWIGDYSATNCNCFICAAFDEEIVIGKNVMIGPNVVMRSSNHGFSLLAEPMQNQPSVGSYIRISDDGWIGANSVILADVTIGDHAIVGAGTVVTTKDVAPYDVVGGVPAKSIRNRHGNA